MKKELTLDEAWRLCLEASKWIAENYIPMVNSVSDLKIQWLDEHGYSNEVHCNCFFCEYGQQNSSMICNSCPGRLVDKDFSCCDPNCYYITDPKGFYSKIKKLYEKRIYEGL